jgi:hypothetical protein
MTRTVLRQQVNRLYPRAEAREAYQEAERLKLSGEYASVTVRRESGWSARGGFRLIASVRVTDERPSGECQVCAGVQCLDAQGRLVLHGYRRPGIGFTVGRCEAVNHLPIPAHDVIDRLLTDASVRHEDALARRAAMAQVRVTLRWVQEPATRAHAARWVQEYGWVANTDAAIQAAIAGAAETLAQVPTWERHPETVATVRASTEQFLDSCVRNAKYWLDFLRGRLRRAEQVAAALANRSRPEEEN